MATESNPILKKCFLFHQVKELFHSCSSPERTPLSSQTDGLMKQKDTALITPGENHLFSVCYRLADGYHC